MLVRALKLAASSVALSLCISMSVSFLSLLVLGDQCKIWSGKSMDFVTTVSGILFDLHH